MNSKIEILPDNIINQIAAGEVVQDPASVVKELIENAVDANAKKIEVEIKAGGMILLRVSDDGEGMSREDLEKSVCRHATSKIKNFEDLQHLSTMGFRGEALASIASVSKMSLFTKKEDSFVLNIEGGEIISIEPSAHVKGTSIEVNSLFYNVPARKKFQKSVSILIAQILKSVNNLALTYPDIAFIFISEGKKILDLKTISGTFREKLLSRIKDILGRDILSNLKWIGYQEGPLSLQGFISTPFYTKKNKLKQFLIINNRFVNNKEVADSIRQGYGMKIGDKEYPVYILHMKLKKNMLDVNIHPQKKYVKISEQLFIKNALKKAVEESFHIEPTYKDMSHDVFVKLSSDYGIKANDEEIEVEPKFSDVKAVDDFDSVKPRYNFCEKEGSFEKFQEKALFGDINIFDKIEERKYLPIFIYEHFFFLKLYSDMSKLAIVDLKAAEASINYDKIITQNDFIKSHIEGQALAFSCEVEFNLDDMFLIEKNISFFKDMGIDLRIFSKNSIAVESMPFYLEEKNIEEFFSLCLKELKLFERIDKDKKMLIKKVMKDLCFMTKKNSRGYSMERGKEIVDKLFKLKDPIVDPFGKKNIISIEKEDIKKLFLGKRNEVCLI